MNRLVAAPVAVALLLAACRSAPPAPPPQEQPRPAPTVSIASLYRQPAERSLIEGIRLYEDAAFRPAEASLRQALREGLADVRDRATAFKYLAFIACAFDRVAECETDFRSAFEADPNFTLTEPEIGHPVWGPAYARVAAQRGH